MPAIGHGLDVLPGSSCQGVPTVAPGGQDVLVFF